MRHRGSTYWSWADFQLPTESYEETRDDGTKIDVQARISRTGGTQLFLGLYNEAGHPTVEEYYDNVPGENVARALKVGMKRAAELAAGMSEPLQI